MHPGSENSPDMSTPPPRKPVIGILGGIGAGKSTTAGEFERAGCLRIDADAIGHELLESEDVRSHQTVGQAPARVDRRCEAI